MLPDSWSHQDIGAVGFTGDTAFDAPSGTFSLKAAGADVWDTADGLHLAWRPLTGDGYILARVRGLQNSSSSAKAGVMIRESLSPGAANAFAAVTVGKGTAFQRRLSTGGVTTSTTGPVSGAPYWVKIERIGNTINAYSSPDGAIWTQVGSETFSMGPTILIGLG
jgi:hypothetical protein